MVNKFSFNKASSLSKLRRIEFRMISSPGMIGVRSFKSMIEFLCWTSYNISWFDCCVFWKLETLSKLNAGNHICFEIYMSSLDKWIPRGHWKLIELWITFKTRNLNGVYPFEVVFFLCSQRLCRIHFRMILGSFELIWLPLFHLTSPRAPNRDDLGYRT